jgi:predicted DNA-binding ribbon-helix-helix protein
MDTREEMSNAEDRFLPVERAQIGVRMEKRMVKVLKGLAEYHDMSLGDLLEGIVLHAFENTPPFSEESLLRIAQLKEVYGMDYSASTIHQSTESEMGSEIT